MESHTPPPLPTASGVGQLPPPIPFSATHPTVVLFYRGWCALFIIIYLTFCIFEVLVALGQLEPPLGLIESALDQKAREEVIAAKRADAPGVAVFTAAIALLYACAAIAPRKPWAWTFGLVMICGTILPFVITAAGAIPLIVHWVKPPVRHYFGKHN